MLLKEHKEKNVKGVVGCAGIMPVWYLRIAETDIYESVGLLVSRIRKPLGLRG